MRVATRLLQSKSGQVQYGPYPPAWIHFHMDNDFTNSGSLGSFTPTATNTQAVAGSTPQITTSEKKFGAGAGNFNCGYLYKAASSATNVGETGFGDWTIEMWVKWDSNTFYPHLFSFDNAANNRMNIYIDYNTSACTFYTEVNGSAHYHLSSSNGAVARYTWTHVALVRSGSTVTLYVNGVSQGSSSSYAFPQGNLNLKIGGSNINNGLDYLVGQMDEFRLTRRVIYTGNFTPPTAPWEGNEYAGEPRPVINDTPVDTNTKLLMHFDDSPFTAAVGTINSNTSTRDTTFKKFGTGSGTFGSGQTIRVPNNITAGDFTWEAWYYNNASTSNFQFLGSFGTEGGSRMAWGMYNGNISIDNFGVGIYVTFGAMPALNQWNHIALVREGSNLRCYVNGSQLGSAYNWGTGQYGNTNDLVLGADSNGISPFLGYIDEWRLSDTCRYTSNFTPPSAPFSP